MPAQYGQPCPCTLAEMTACHSWPQGPCHQTFLFEPVVTSSGLSVPLRSAFHCDARSGRFEVRSLNPGHALLPEQYGQPVLLVLDETEASQR